MPTQKELQAYIRRRKTEVPCCDCGRFYPYFLMEHDHVRGEKLFNLGSVGYGRKSGNDREKHAIPFTLTYEIVDEEIDKCDVICTPCARIRQYGYLLAEGWLDQFPHLQPEHAMIRPT